MRPAALFVVLGCAACASTRTEWRSADLPGKPFEDVWTMVKTVSEQNGYGEDAAATDRGLKKFQSRWRTRELAFGRTHRTRVKVELERLAAGAEPRGGTVTPGWRIDLAVERQVVKDMARAMNPAEADWSRAGQDADMERLLLGQLLVKLGLPLAPLPRNDGRNDARR